MYQKDHHGHKWNLWMVRHDSNYMIIPITKKVACDLFKTKPDVWSPLIIPMMCLTGPKGLKLKVTPLPGNVTPRGLRW